MTPNLSVGPAQSGGVPARALKFGLRVARGLRRRTRAALKGALPGRPAIVSGGSRLPVGDVRRVQVGCGPHNLKAGWCNVDIRDFPGIDAVMDVTQRWPWSRLDYVYGEHFLEHLDLDGALRFLVHAGNALAPGGRLRLSTPSLEWVLKTHFDFGSGEEARTVQQTMATNRAFHGWGHQFLYSKTMLEWLLRSVGYQDIRFYDYGASDDPNLRGIEQHGKFSVAHGYPSVWIVEAVRGATPIEAGKELRQLVEAQFLRFVRGGH